MPTRSDRRPAETRSTVLRVRISPEALERVRVRAAVLGLDVSTAVRLAVHEWLERRR